MNNRSRISLPRGLRTAAIVAAVGISALLLLWFRADRAAVSAPVNAVLITLDTVRADHLGGNEGFVTPVLDDLANHGVRVVGAFSHNPLTLPSHASLLTGLTPPRHGVRDNVGFVLGPDVPTVSEQFRNAGYQTAAFVSGFPLHRRFGLARGFDVYDDYFAQVDPGRSVEVERQADEVVAAATAWLESLQAATPRPFFLWIHFYDPHLPYEPPEPYASRFRDRPYDGEIAFVDSQIGVFLEALRRTEREKNTLLLITADHGEGLGEHGEPTHGLFVYETTIAVPLILFGAGIPNGRVVSAATGGIDVVPTLLDLAGVAALPGAEGRSLRPALAGQRMKPSESAYVESFFGRLCCGWAPLRSWRDERWVFIDAPRPELYDLSSDPAQLRNVLTKHPGEARRLSSALESFTAHTPAIAPKAQLSNVTEQLRSLGYLGGGRVDGPSLRDPKDVAALYVRLGKAIDIELTDPPAAARELQAVLHDDPRNPLARRRLASALAKQGRFEDAISELNTLLGFGESSTDALVLLGECYRLAGRPNEAVTLLRSASLKHPESLETWGALGRALVAVGRLDEAREAYERAVALVEDDAAALAGLAELAIERGDLAEARKHLEPLWTGNSNDVDAGLKFGIVLARMNETERAIEVFKTVLAREPGNIDALIDLGGALMKIGREAEAVAHLEQAVASGVTDHRFWNALGFARLQNEDETGAADALQQSLRLRPDQPNITAALRSLQRH